MPEEEEEQEIENLLENIMKENFTNLAKEIDFQEVQQAQSIPKKLGLRKNTLRHIIITLPKFKDKERILKAVRERDTVTYKGVHLQLSADFSKENLQATGGWKEVFKVMKDKHLHPRLLYPAKLSFRMEVHALAGVAQWIECQPVNQRVTSSIPSQGTCLGCGPGPQ